MRADAIGFFWEEIPVVKEVKDSLQDIKDAVLKEVPAICNKPNLEQKIDTGVIGVEGYVYDIEIYPNFFYVLFRKCDSDEYLCFDIDTLPALIKFLHTPGLRLFGWNSAAYDDQILNWINRSRIKPTCRQLYNLSMSIIYEKTRLNTKIPVRSVDIFQLLAPMPSLKKAGSRINYPIIQDLPFNPMFELDPGQIEVVKDYCKNDVDTTYEITRQNIDHYELRKFLTHKFKIEKGLYQSSEAHCAETIITELYCRQTNSTLTELYKKSDKIKIWYRSNPIIDFVPEWIQFETEPLKQLLAEIKQLKIPTNKKGHPNAAQLKHSIEIGDKIYDIGAGGIHSQDNPGVFDTGLIVDIDITSMYPQTLIRDSLYPGAFGIQWIQIYEQIRTQRLADKKAGNKVAAEAQKIILNSLFGKLGSIYSPNYDPQLLLRVTVTGQLVILMLIEALNEAGFTILSANTDGIMINLTQDRIEEFRQIYRKWEKYTRYEMEETWIQRLVRRDVNNYVTLDVDGNLKKKGAFGDINIKKDTQALVIRNAAIDYLMYGLNYCDSIRQNSDIRAFLFKFTAVSGFTIKIADKPLLKTNRWYCSTESTDQMTKFGGVKNTTYKIPNGSNVVLVNTLPQQFPKDLDYEYYELQCKKLILNCL